MSINSLDKNIYILSYIVYLRLLPGMLCHGMSRDSFFIHTRFNLNGVWMKYESRGINSVKQLKNAVWIWLASVIVKSDMNNKKVLSEEKRLYCQESCWVHVYVYIYATQARGKDKNAGQSNVVLYLHVILYNTHCCPLIMQKVHYSRMQLRMFMCICTQPA